MKAWTLYTSPRAISDIQKAIDYYNEQQRGLGKKFYAAINRTAGALKRNPNFQVRYDDVRCLLVKGFPYMLHYTIEKETRSIILYAVIHTSLNPDEH